jgi:hypothetical protein
MALLRHHYYCEACDGTWFAEAEAAIEADCKFCGARDVFPYRSDKGRRPRLAVIAGNRKPAKTPARAGKLKRSA